MCLAASRSRAGVYVNVNNDTYACTDGTVIVVQNDYAKEYNRAYKILRVMRRGDVRIMRKCAQKVWKTFGNRAKNGMCVVARAMASARRGIGYEELIVHWLYTKNGRIASFMRGPAEINAEHRPEKACPDNTAKSECLSRRRCIRQVRPQGALRVTGS